MPRKRYRKGRYGNNVILFQHPSRQLDEITGLWVDAPLVPAPNFMVVDERYGYGIYRTFAEAAKMLPVWMLRTGKRDLFILEA